jgi:hypothetical protein
MRGRAACGDGEACGWGWMAGGSAARVVCLLSATVRRTPRRGLGDSGLLAGNGPKTGLSSDALVCRSRAGAKFGWRASLIGEKVIGHGIRGFAPRVAGRRPLVVAHWGQRALALLAGRGTLALLHQPACQHGGAVFFEPGIQQLGDLLAEISCMTKPRKLIALQGIAGSREKELPRGLGFVRAQGDLQGKR